MMPLSNLIKRNLTLVLYGAVALSIFFQALTWGDAYRFFAYSALLLGIGVYCQTASENERERRLLLKCLLPFLGFFILEWIATLYFPWNVKVIRHVLLATGLMMSIVLMARDHARIKEYIAPTLIFAVYAYTLFQCVFIYMLGQVYGTTKNPHYLAIYSALFLVVATFLAINWKRSMHRYGMLFSVVVLGHLLLNTASRPTWIALIIASLVVFVCLRSKDRWLSIALAGFVFAALLISNTSNFKTRLVNLAANVSTEERVAIWEDTWAMQQHSSQQQWMFGHGAESFEHDFRPYSRYHAMQGITYNSPHNAALELLYLHGVVGLMAVVGFMLWLYCTLFSHYFRFTHRSAFSERMIVMLLLVILTITLATVAITLPFFVSIHLNVIALVLGVMFYLERLEQ